MNCGGVSVIRSADSCLSCTCGAQESSARRAMEEHHGALLAGSDFWLHRAPGTWARLVLPRSGVTPPGAGGSLPRAQSMQLTLTLFMMKAETEASLSTCARRPGSESALPSCLSSVSLPPSARPSVSYARLRAHRTPFPSTHRRSRSLVLTPPASRPTCPRRHRPSVEGGWSWGSFLTFQSVLLSKICILRLYVIKSQRLSAIAPEWVAYYPNFIDWEMRVLWTMSFDEQFLI